jgi:hypothetical protein
MSNSYFLSISLHPLPFLIHEPVHRPLTLSLREIFRFGFFIRADKIEEKTGGKQLREIFMAETSNRLPFLYVASYFIFLIGVSGLIYIFFLRPPPDIFKGLLYIFLGFIAFGAGEILNHPRPPLITTSMDNGTSSKQFHRKRNPCSLGNLFDIGALLLFFIGLSALLFRQ